jgi:hypothetical protein
MDFFIQDKEKQCSGSDYVDPGSKDTKDTQVQLVISLALGLFGFFAFCVGLHPQPSPAHRILGHECASLADICSLDR